MDIRSRNPSQRGFTLVEVLAVICLVTILLFLLFPLLGHVKARGESTKCASSLRQIGIALFNYAGEHEGEFPVAGGTIHRGAVDPVTQRPSWAEQIETYVGNDWRIFQCITCARILPANSRYSYFLGTRAAYLETGALGPVRLSRITHRSKQILAGDNTFAFEEADADKDDYSVNCPFAGTRPHQGKSNILFADGSIRACREFDRDEMQISYDDPEADY